jgi:hypothetical protein
MTASLAGHRLRDVRRRHARLDADGERGETFRLEIVSDRRLHVPGALEHQDSLAGGYRYECGRVGFSAFDSDTIADRLDQFGLRILDRFEAGGVDLDELDRPGVSVRAHLGVEGYAHTISAVLLGRLARIHAELWIEAAGD